MSNAFFRQKNSGKKGFISPYVSNKLKSLSFVLIFFVLFIHSGFHGVEIGAMPLNIFIQGIISDKIGRIAVPLFFTISGYLFYFNVDTHDVKVLPVLIKKISSRIKTLLIPYLFGCLFFLLFVLIFEYTPFLKKYVNGSIKPVMSGAFLNVIKNIFWSSNIGRSPLAFHLWFLRDLIILSCFSPLFFYGIKYLRWGLLITVLIICSFFPYNPQGFLISVFWFLLGATVALENVNIDFKIPRWGGFSLSILFLVICFVEQYYKLSFYSFGKILIMLIGISGTWFLFDSFKKDFSAEGNAPFYTSYTFFIYIYHEPAINVVRKAIIMAMGAGSFQYLISYLLSPLVFVVLAVFIGYITKRLFPGFFSMITGGRG